MREMTARTAAILTGLVEPTATERMAAEPVKPRDTMRYRQ